MLFTNVLFLMKANSYAQMIKYENKFIEIFPTGEVEHYLLIIRKTSLHK